MKKLILYILLNTGYLILFANIAEAGTIINRPLAIGLTAGLVGHWTFDGKDMIGNQTSRDISGQGNNGTLTNGPVRVIGRIGQALNFDGVDDSVNIGTPSSLNLTGNMSIFTWVNASTLPGLVMLVCKNTGSSSGQWCLDISSGKKVEARWDGNSIALSNISLTTNRWYHVGWTRTGTTGNWSVSIYVDGVLDNTATSAVNPASNVSAFIGKFSTTFFNGSIDDVRIYNRALSKDEIKRLYNLGGTFTINKSLSAGTLKDGLVGHWTFDGKDMATNTALDISGNNNHGVLTNGPTKAIGRIGQALDFDGVDDYVDAGSRSSLDLDSTNPRSFAVWVMVHSKVANANIIRLNLGNALGLDPQGDQFYFFINTSCSGASLDIRTTTLFSLNTWHHVTAVYDGSNLRIYLNGKDDTQTPTTGTGASCTLSSVNIGRSTTPVYFDGLIDDVRVYNRVLSQDEIKRLYNLGGTFTINKSLSAGTLKDGLVGHWTFDGKDMATNTALDISGNNNHGVLTNGPTKAIGRIGQALNFDGVNDEITLPAMTLTAGTFSVWAKPAFDLSPTARYIILGDIPSGSELQFQVDTAGGIDNYTLGYRGNFGNSCDVIADPDFTSNELWKQWRHVAVTWNNSTGAEIFVNGVSSGVTTCTTGVIASVNLSIGSTDSANFWKGLIDDVRVYNRALTPAEIQRLYNLGR